MASSDVKYTTGSVIAVSQDSDGQYTATQVDSLERIPNVPFGPDSIIPFSFSEGPISVSGQIDTSTLSIQASLKVFGHEIGSFSGNLKDGLCINVNLFVVKGKVCLQLRNGNELWIVWQLSSFGKEFNGEKLILKLPI
ncbi:hypothetical protein F4778DRAFT_779465 [Xylariomycetidae sp. FL2044]|nr:hypothetical protein F4778DRAFT_779465 [Xylariomycetidae sp. FL2044]